MDHPPQSDAAENRSQPRPSAHDLQVGLASDPGRVRERNEDASLACHFLLARGGEPPLPVGLYVLADGLGGHAGGEQASALAVHQAAEHVIRQVCLPLLAEEGGGAGPPPIHEVLQGSVQTAHRALQHRLPEAGTTLTLALLLAEGVYVAHVGDSRAYAGRRGALRQLTRDHSMAARLAEISQTTEEEPGVHQNVLYKALGQGGEGEPEIRYHDLGQGQYLLLCCDGLWAKVPDEEMAAIVEAAPTPDVACQNLVARANECGGEDNISVILVARGWPLPEGGEGAGQS